jgi:hypothetical protein
VAARLISPSKTGHNNVSRDRLAFKTVASKSGALDFRLLLAVLHTATRMFARTAECGLQN